MKAKSKGESCLDRRNCTTLAQAFGKAALALFLPDRKAQQDCSSANGSSQIAPTNQSPRHEQYVLFRGKRIGIRSADRRFF